MVQNFRKVILLGVRRFVDIFFGGGVSLQNQTFVFFFFSFFFFLFCGGGGSFLYILGRFKVKIQNGNIFLGRKFSIFFGYT